MFPKLSLVIVLLNSNVTEDQFSCNIALEWWTWDMYMYHTIMIHPVTGISRGAQGAMPPPPPPTTDPSKKKKTF